MRGELQKCCLPEQSCRRDDCPFHTVVRVGRREGRLPKGTGYGDICSVAQADL